MKSNVFHVKISKCMGAFISRNRYSDSERVLSARCTTLEQGGNRERVRRLREITVNW